MIRVTKNTIELDEGKQKSLKNMFSKFYYIINEKYRISNVDFDLIVNFFVTMENIRLQQRLQEGRRQAKLRREANG